MIGFELVAIFIPFFGPWICLKPEPVQTSDPFRLERALV
jgi:hypothetical protein